MYLCVFHSRFLLYKLKFIVQRIYVLKKKFSRKNKKQVQCTRHVSAGATHLLFIIQSFKHLENFTNFPYNIRYLIYRSECILFNIKKLLHFFKHKAPTTSIKEHSIKKQTIKENSRFASLNILGNSYFLTSKIPFKPDGALKPATIEKVFCFAYDMSFTTKGKQKTL